MTQPPTPAEMARVEQARAATVELLGYRDWEDANDYRLTGREDRTRDATVQAFLRAIEAAYAAGMERAAEICDNMAEKSRSPSVVAFFGNQRTKEAVTAAEAMADAIRAEKGPRP